MTTLTALEQHIAALLSERMAREVPSTDTDLFAAGAIDSMAFVELLHHLEEDFGFRFLLEDLDIDDFRSISRIALFVSKVGGRHVGETGVHANRSTIW